MKLRGERVHIGLQFRGDTTHHGLEKHGNISVRSSWLSGSRKRTGKGTRLSNLKAYLQGYPPSLGFHLPKRPQLFQTGDHVCVNPQPQGVYSISNLTVTLLMDLKVLT